jgi:DNA-binding transcriptional LysR family regulator
MATVADFLAAYPEISLELCSDSALTDIVASRFDAGIRPADRLERDMTAVRVSDPIPVVVVAAPSYLRRRSKPRTPADLSAHDCIRIRLQSGATLGWRFRVQRRTVEVSVEGRLILNDSPMALTAATRGAGLFQLPRIEVAQELLDGRLITVLDDYQPPPVEGFFLYYPGRRQPRPALKVLVEFLRDARRRRRR